MQEYIQHIAGYILLYSLKHGFEDDWSLLNRDEVKIMLQSLNREKVL